MRYREAFIAVGMAAAKERDDEAGAASYRPHFQAHRAWPYIQKPSPMVLLLAGRTWVAFDSASMLPNPISAPFLEPVDLLGSQHTHRDLIVTVVS